jgi:hypothetical protein
MTVSTTIDTVLGVVSTDVAGAGSVTLAGVKTQITPLTTASTLSLQQAGVVTVSGSAVLTFVMPTAASCPGSMFVVRSLSNHAHVLTGSQESNGTKVFSLLASGSSAVNGSALTLALGGTAGAATGGGPSVALLSDGKNFLVIGSSGSVALSGT